jgi:hypothetical protein
MAAVLTETREQEAPLWKSKVDDRGQTHVYRKITASELKVGDHLLEHVTGHTRQVATPILAVEARPDGILITIPDRHSDNSPVQELYPADHPIFISKTPHLEQHEPDANIFVQLEKKEPEMSELETERHSIKSAHWQINAGVENMILTQDTARAREAAQAIRKGCGDLSDAIILGSDAVAELRIKDAFDFARWNTALTESAKFTGSRSDRLSAYAQAVENPELREQAAYAQGALDTATQVALEQRKRGILMSLTGPLAVYALQDGQLLDIIRRPEKEESGVMLAKVSKNAVLQRSDGTLIAVPVPDASILRRIEMGKPVDLIASEPGVYVRKEVMEKQAEVNKQQYPRLEAHLKGPDNTWHSASLYADKEGHLRGSIVIENRELGIAEKHPVEFTEKVSEKTGEKYLSASATLGDGKTAYVNLVPHESKGERFLSASFAERDPGKERGHQIAQISGTGGTLKPNAAMLEKADKDRTLQYVRKTLKLKFHSFSVRNIKAG